MADGGTHSGVQGETLILGESLTTRDSELGDFREKDPEASISTRKTLTLPGTWRSEARRKASQGRHVAAAFGDEGEDGEGLLRERMWGRVLGVGSGGM